MTAPAEVATAECPKDMTYGPCGGVGGGGRCEVAEHPCVFLPLPTVRWASPGTLSGADAGAVSTRAGRELVEIMARRPAIVTEIPASPMDSVSLAASADVLRGSVDAVLSGDSGVARVQFPPAYRAELLRRSGLRAWIGLNCRDRNRVALEGEIAALADAEVAAVHCVTGDHTASGHRPDAKPVFDLEGTTLVPLARERGLLVSVAESPAAPPVDRRAARTAEKHRAGAQLCLPQYAGEVSELADFIGATAAEGGAMPFLPGVPLIVDREGAALLASFAAAVMPRGYVETVLDAVDPFSAGIRAAVSLAERLVAVPGVAGVVIAGGTRAGSELRFAEALALVARELGGEGA